MAQLKTLNPDVNEQKLVFALMLLDRFTETNQTLGKLTVRIANQPFEPPFVPVQQPGQASFFFFDLPPAAYTLQVRSNKDGKVDDAKPPQEDEPPYYYLSEAPYYFPIDIPFVVPPANGQWPAFPNLLLADQTIPLGDPAQPAAFRDQRALATLQPTTSYPFPAGASLLRGRVLASGNPLGNARVRRIDINDGLEYRTGPDGYYVLFFNVKGADEQITVRASHVFQPDKDQPVTIRRGMTVTQNIVMAP